MRLPGPNLNLDRTSVRFNRFRFRTSVQNRTSASVVGRGGCGVATIKWAGVCERKCGRFRLCLLFGFVTGSHGVLVAVLSFCGPYIPIPNFKSLILSPYLLFLCLICPKPLDRKPSFEIDEPWENR